MLTYNLAFAWGLIPQYVDLVRESTYWKVPITVADVKIVMHDSDIVCRSYRIKFLSVPFIDWLIARYRLRKLFGVGASAAAVRGSKTYISTEKKEFFGLKNFKSLNQTKVQ
jgi:hypothetical protein